jgi:hypothetical protein
MSILGALLICTASASLAIFELRRLDFAGISKI